MQCSFSFLTLQYVLHRSELYHQHKPYKLAMADFCPTAELDDLHRLLPREILADIGIADVEEDTTARCSHGAVHVEELAAHLANVLGLASRRHQRQPRTTATQPIQGCGRMIGEGANDGIGGMAYHPPALGKNGLVFDFEAMQLAQRFVPGALCAGGTVYHPLPPRRHGSAGTGVFLPRAEAYQTRASRQARPPRKEATTMLKLQRQ